MTFIGHIGYVSLAVDSITIITAC